MKRECYIFELILVCLAHVNIHEIKTKKNTVYELQHRKFPVLQHPEVHLQPLFIMI